MTVVTNAGNAVIWPIIHVHGDGADSWSITNNSVVDDNGNALAFYYSPTLGFAFPIPPGDYAILDMFQNQITLASTGDDLAEGVDVLRTDFFPLGPGTNNLTTTGGATIEVVRPVTAWA